MPHHIAKKLVELLYFRETSVLKDEKEMFMNAVKSLKINGTFEDDGFKAPANGMCATLWILFWLNHFFTNRQFTNQ